MKKLFHVFLVLPWRALGWLRHTLANLLMLAVVLLVIASMTGKNTTTMPDRATLVLEPGRIIVEQRSYGSPLSGLLEGEHARPDESVLHEMTSAIRWAAHDNSITALVIRPDWLQGSDLGKLESMARAIKEFRDSGKPVIAVGDNYNQSQYYLASLADRIYLNPMGSVQMHGFAAYQSYIKDLLDKLAISIHVFRAGQFKSFVEPFIRNDMSPEARENLAQWLGQQWTFYAGEIEARRKLAPGSLNEFINSQDVLLSQHDNNPARLALQYKLVDALATRNEAEGIIDALGEYVAEPVDVSAYYQHVQNRKQARQLLEQTRQVAVIRVSGQIMDGHQPPGYAGAESVIELIRQARENPNMAAIVLRIDSPGGSAFASELIRSELAAAQADGKPVVASMGGVAASGGYWIAASADEIWASPATITGSIGVFGVIPTLENTLGNWGIHSDGFSTTALGDAMQLDRPMNPLVARVLQQGVEFTYQEFLRLVASGRKRDAASIDRIAQGRVWTGAEAHKLGLVDHLGETGEAIAAAARLAKLDNYEPMYLEPELSAWETLMQDLNGQSLLPQAIGKTLTTLYQSSAMQQLANMQMLNDPNHLYAQCWECRIRVR